MQAKHVVIFRTAGSYLDYNSYNCQELGLAKALVKRGFKTTLIMCGPEQLHIAYTTEGGHVDIYYLPCKGIHQTLSVFKGWQQLLLRLQPDIIQVHDMGILMTYLVTRWAKKKDLKTILIQGGYETTQKPVLKQYEKLFNMLLGKNLLSKVAGIGCKTKAAAEYLARYTNKATSLTRIGLDESKFHNQNQATAFKKKNGLEGRKVLLYVGRMESRRNPLFLITLMDLLPDDYVLLLVGDGPLMPDIKAKMSNKVVILGKRSQEELPKIYEAADLFLLASNYEIYGMVIMEAMYFGLPVISTATAGADTIITPETGVIVPNLDAQAWISAIKRAMQLVPQMKPRCKSYIREHLVWDEAVDAFITLYNSI